jgi:hypothetical protein
MCLSCTCRGPSGSNELIKFDDVGESDKLMSHLNCGSGSGIMVSHAVNKDGLQSRRSCVVSLRSVTAKLRRHNSISSLVEGESGEKFPCCEQSCACETHG